jgi:hypothetical protein
VGFAGTSSTSESRQLGFFSTPLSTAALAGYETLVPLRRHVPKHGMPRHARPRGTRLPYAKVDTPAPP